MAGPLEELVARILRRVEQFKDEHGLPEVEVRLELVDGSLHRLKTLSAEPGFGFLSFCPHCGEEEEPEEVIVPLGAVRELRIGARDHAHTVGFVGAPGANAGER